MDKLFESSSDNKHLFTKTWIELLDSDREGGVLNKMAKLGSLQSLIKGSSSVFLVVNEVEMNCELSLIHSSNSIQVFKYNFLSILC